MQAILDSLIELFWAVFGVFASVGQVIVPLTPLLLWVAFWTFAVDWVKLRSFFLKGGIVGVVLIALMAIFVWGSISPPPDGQHYILGRSLDNFVGKTVYVTGLVCIMFLSGAVQLAGVFGQYTPPQPEEAADDHHGGHDAH